MPKFTKKAIDFAQCLATKLEKKPGFGKKRVQEAIRAYERYRDQAVRDGLPLLQAQEQASARVIREVEEVRRAKVKAGVYNIGILGGFAKRLDLAPDITTAWGRRDLADKLGVALSSVIEEDVRVKGHASVMTEYNVNHGKFWSLFRDVMDNFGKGAFGRQLGRSHMPNVVKELFREGSSGDQAAKDIAQAYRKFRKMYVALMNETGVTMRPIQDEGLPTAFSAVSVANRAKDEFVADMNAALDWNKTTWPNGDLVEAAERIELLELSYDAIRTGDYTVFDQPFAQLGGRWGKELEQGRNFRYASADAWQAMHNKYGDGEIFDVMTRDMDKSAFSLATAKLLGTNPDYMLKQMRALTDKRADTAGGKKSPQKIDRHLRRFDVMHDMLLKHNPMDPESALANTISTTSNLASAAMLKSAVFTAVPGDILTTIATRWANNQPVIAFLGEYIRAMFPGAYRTAAVDALGAGHVIDDLISNNFIAARFGAGQQYGMALSRRVADFTMRTSFMSRHTNALRAANQREMMLRLYKLRHTKFNDIRERVIFERAGITEAEWDRTRHEMTAWSPVQGVNYFRPIDMVDKLGHDLTNKFQSMIWNEGRRMVLQTSLEAMARIKRGVRQDTAAGALLHSLGMFHGYPVTNMLIFSRLIMSLDGNNMGRAKLIASLGIGGALVGAMAQQLRSFTQGKEFNPMDNPEFWIKAMASGGSFAIWGDFITGAMRSDTKTAMLGVLAGPLGNVVGEATDLSLGTAFQWAEIGDRTTEMTLGAKGADLIDALRRSVIPQTWLYAYALERDILEPLQEMLDPVGMKRSQSRRKRMAKDQGTPFRRGYEPGRTFVTPFLTGQ